MYLKEYIPLVPFRSANASSLLMFDGNGPFVEVRKAVNNSLILTPRYFVIFIFYAFIVWP